MKKLSMVLAAFLVIGLSNCVYGSQLVTHNLVVHLDANAGVTTDASGGVSAWTDQASLGGTQIAGMGNGAYRPQLVQNAINGKAAVRFDGVDDWMVMNDNLTGGELDVDTLSVFIVFKLNQSLDKDQYLLGTRTSFHSNHYGVFYDGNGSDKTIWFSRNSSLGFVGAGSVTPETGALDNGYSQFSGLWYPNDIVACRQDGVQGTGKAGADAPAGTFTKMIIGSDTGLGSALCGDIAEILIYNTGLNNTDRDAVEAYLADKYTVPEPMSISLMLIGCGLASLRKRS